MGRLRVRQRLHDQAFKTLDEALSISRELEISLFDPLLVYARRAMEAAALDYTYRYRRPSEVMREATGTGLHLATCGAEKENPHFFKGLVREPRSVGMMLVALTEVVRAHYFLRRPALLDPVVTSNDSMLRFEGFSGCCGVYVRADLATDAFDGELQRRGTTNVDFNDPMRAALTRVSNKDEVRLSVGHDEVTLERSGEQIVEKKVKLPSRWLKSFSEVQAYQPRMAQKLEVSGTQAQRFLAGLPTTSPPKRPSYVVQSGSSIRLTQRKTKDTVRVEGVHRLRAFQGLVSRAHELRVWEDPGSGTSAWELNFDVGRMFLVLSPEIYRGFSGEGQNLRTLALDDWESVLHRVRAQLKWQNELGTDALCTATGLPADQVDAALAALGARGLAGYDLATGTYFHRELPFDLEHVTALQPRLLNAEKLVSNDGVRKLVVVGEECWDADVAGTGVTHRVRLRPDGDRCSCPWFSKHQGERGPCKHILASRIVAY